jgi:hypothetical protein
MVSHVQPSEDILSCEMHCFCSGVDEDAGLPGCDAMLLGECFPVFCKIVLLSELFTP